MIRSVDFPRFATVLRFMKKNYMRKTLPFIAVITHFYNIVNNYIQIQILEE